LKNIVFELDEEWKKIKNYPYKISNFGRVKRIKSMQGTFSGKILKPFNDGVGYLSIGLSKNGKVKTFYIHKLVAEAFIGPCPENKEVNHLDGIKENPHADNLEYVTKSENSKHAYKLGLIKKGESRRNSKLDRRKVIEIKKLYEDGKHTQLELAKKFNMSQQAISKIVCGETWRHLT